MEPQNICRLNELPEGLLCSNILSRLPLTDAVRSSLLSSQWRYHWTRIPHLHFSPHFFTQMKRSVRHPGIPGRQAITHIKGTMEHILIHHKAPLECFLFYIPSKFFRNGMSRRFIEAMDIEKCIDSVAKKAVERMSLEAVAHPWQKKMSLPTTIFGCKTLLHLQIVGFIFPEIPSLAENFKMLRVCALANIENLTDNRLQRLVELCPVLEKLVLVSCRELIHLQIQAPHLSCLILAGCSSLESLTADCPQLLLLKTRKVLKLHKLQINSYRLVELYIKDSNRLSKLQLNSCVLVKRVGSVEGQAIRSFSDVESLRKLTLEGLESFPEVKLVGLFPGLEELNVSPRMMGTAAERGNELGEEKVRDLMFPKLNIVHMDLSYLEREVFAMDLSYYERDDELARLDFLLRNSPLLKNLYCICQCCPEDLKNQILGLKRGSVEIKILNEDKSERECSMVIEGLDRCGNFWYENEVEDSEDENEVESSDDENEIYGVDDYEDYPDNIDYEVFEDYDYASG